MKNFGAILIALAAGASFVAAMPTHPMAVAVEARIPHDIPHENALDVRNHKKHGKGAAGNGTAAAVGASAASNATASANNGTANAGKGGKGGKAGKNAGDAQGANGLLSALLGGGAADNTQGAATQHGSLTNILQGLENILP
ncbi:hypothetical protein GGR54DRAFT_352103 [Hypoxylon sp. NC1633]|nr:hypothetical protein GGR54DRAFT_352103 [Hypoxylon sp. NC1633]